MKTTIDTIISRLESNYKGRSDLLVRALRDLHLPKGKHAALTLGMDLGREGVIPAHLLRAILRVIHQIPDSSSQVQSQIPVNPFGEGTTVFKIHELLLEGITYPELLEKLKETGASEKYVANVIQKYRSGIERKGEAAWWIVTQDEKTRALSLKYLGEELFQEGLRMKKVPTRISLRKEWLK